MEEDEPLPLVRAGKPTMMRERNTADDIGTRPSTAIPFLTPSSRNTWPQGLRESKPGTFAFEQVPTLVKTPWEHNRALRSTPRSSGSTKRSAISSDTFSRLPREILHCVLDRLRDAHITESQLDVASYRSDLRKLCIANKQWHRVAREHLYREIWLPLGSAASSTRHHLLQTLSRGSSSLRLLQRTLEESPGLAYQVKRIRIPSSVTAEFNSWMYLDGRHGKDVLAGICELIRKCPNLCALSGYSPLACNQTGELLDALASRPKLREHIWDLPGRPSDWHTLTRPGAFVDLHSQWRQLQTFVLCRDGTLSDCLGAGTVSAVLQRLPALRHLMLRGLLRTEFHNGTLLMLPALRSLRLEGLEGVDDHGLQQLVHTRLALSLERVSLFVMGLTSLRTVQILLDSLPRLRKFSFVQQSSPELEEVFSFTGASFSLASHTLEYLYWHPLLPGAAAAILANAIAAGKFPKLRSIKIPCDDDGAVQKLCRPIRQRNLTEDEVRIHAARLASAEEIEYRATSQFIEVGAQLRAQRERKDSVFSVTVEDEDGVERLQWTGSYLGNIASKIEYCLQPDVEGGEYSYALLEDLSKPARLREGHELAVGLDVLF